MASPPPSQTRTHLAFHHDSNLSTLNTKVQSIFPASTLDEASRQTFKGITFPAPSHILITTSTIFHPQGGGQPSDTGTITSPTSDVTFTVLAVRTGLSPTHTGQVLHLGTFPGTSTFSPADEVTQHLDLESRALYSRLHTAGHVLGSAVRHLLEPQIPGFDELKASHFPDSAACEFAGLIDGKHKAPIQAKVDEFVARDMPVEIEWWTDEDFRREGLERLIPPEAVREMMGLEEGEKWRVVRIRGAEVYPCGGTHVASTKGCGKVTVRKISRQKGTSKVGYNVD